MTFQEFLPRMTEAVREAADSEKEIRIQTILKNNNEKKTALMFLDPSAPPDTPSPIVYLEPYYQKAVDGVPLHILGRMACEAASVSAPDFAIERIRSYETAKDHIFCQMLNKEMNRESLAERPHEDWQDLAIAYYCELGRGSSAAASTRITYDLMEHFNVSEETLRADAWKNTLSREAVIRPLSGVLAEMGGPVQGEVSLYLLSNGEMMNGAIAAAYPDTCKKAEDLLGKNFFLLPSSIHEFLLLPDDGDMDAGRIDKMIEAINETEVAKNEVLSNHAYYYDGKTQTISIAAEYQEKQKLEQRKEKSAHLEDPGKVIPFPAM